MSLLCMRSTTRLLATRPLSLRSARLLSRRSLSSSAPVAVQRLTVFSALRGTTTSVPRRGMANKRGGDKEIKNKNKRAVETISTYDVSTCKAAMAEAIAALTSEYQGIRAGGRATAEQLEGITVRAYGNPNTPLAALGTISSRSATALLITPHDPATTKEIMAAIKSSGKELSAQEDSGASKGGAPGVGTGILVTFPKANKEIRDQLIKLARSKAEDTRTRIKRVHSDARGQLKRIEGMGKDDIYKIEQGITKATEEANKSVKTMLDAKEKELNTA